MIAQLGEKFNVNIGSWHGPNMVASILRFVEFSLYFLLLKER